MQVNIQDLKYKVIDHLTRYGPSLPVQISKQINSNILFAGAVLSELIANQKVKISSAKIGGSPVYYIGGQEHKLVMLYPHLHEREKKAYDLLKENKVLYDKSLEPWQRVALRDLKDFAHPVEHNNELFWRWYLVQEEEALDIIKESFKQNIVQEMPVKEEINEVKVEPQVVQNPQVEIKETKLEQPLVNLEEIQKQLEFKQEVKLEVKEEKKIKVRKKRVKKTPEEFYNLINNYFTSKNINKIEESIIKKNKEFDFIAELNTNLGLVRFFITVKDKKKISDADLSLSHNKSQLKKLPLIFLSSGELDKTAKEYMQSNYLIFEKL